LGVHDELEASESAHLKASGGIATFGGVYVFLPAKFLVSKRKKVLVVLDQLWVTDSVRELGQRMLN
jgi:hypothetical protein